MQQKLPTQTNPEVIGESIIGPKHEKKDIGCEDNWDAETGNNYLIIAVGDGLGSAKKSAVGSEIATTTATSFVKHWLENTNHSIESIEEDQARSRTKDTLVDVRKKISNVADENEKQLNDYATTLSLVVVTPSWYIAFAIGDSGIVGTSDGDHKSLLSREETEYSNSTTPITGNVDSVNKNKRFKFERSSLELVSVFTDGLDPFFWDLDNRNEPRDQLFDQISDFVSAVEGFQSENTKEQFRSFVDDDRFHEYSSDDKTLVVGHMPQNEPGEICKESSNVEYQSDRFLDCIRSVDKATARQIAEQVGCSKSTVYRRVNDLENDGVVASEVDNGTKYWIGTNSGK